MSSELPISRRRFGAYLRSMGLFIYDNADPPIRIDDRTLWHLKTVILTKLRRGETFSVSWAHPHNEDGGYTTVWLHPARPA